MWHVYIIRGADDSLYTDVTTDVARRVSEHNTGKGGAYTSAHRPVELAYQETFRCKSKALRRESQIKGWTREKKIKLVNSKNTLCLF